MEKKQRILIIAAILLLIIAVVCLAWMQNSTKGMQATIDDLNAQLAAATEDAAAITAERDILITEKEALTAELADVGPLPRPRLTCRRRSTP